MKVLIILLDELENPKIGSNWYIPLPVTYLETLQSQEYWTTHVVNFGMIRPPEQVMYEAVVKYLKSQL